MIVIDASAILELLLNTQRAAIVAERMFSSNESLHAPHLIDIEVAQVLRRYVLSDQLHRARANEALNDYSQVSIERYSHVELLPRIWELRESITAYDAAYVALAEGLEAPLITCDAKLARAHGHLARVEVID